MASLVELRRRRRELLEQIRAMLDRAEVEGRDLTGAERAEFDRIEGEVHAVDGRSERREQLGAAAGGGGVLSPLVPTDRQPLRALIGSGAERHRDEAPGPSSPRGRA